VGCRLGGGSIFDCRAKQVTRTRLFLLPCKAPHRRLLLLLSVEVLAPCLIRAGGRRECFVVRELKPIRICIESYQDTPSISSGLRVVHPAPAETSTVFRSIIAYKFNVSR
jgi:hypothetical protein